MQTATAPNGAPVVADTLVFPDGTLPVAAAFMGPTDTNEGSNTGSDAPAAAANAGKVRTWYPIQAVLTNTDGSTTTEGQTKQRLVNRLAAGDMLVYFAAGNGIQNLTGGKPVLGTENVMGDGFGPGWYSANILPGDAVVPSGAATSARHQQAFQWGMQQIAGSSAKTVATSSSQGVSAVAATTPKSKLWLVVGAAAAAAAYFFL